MRIAPRTMLCATAYRVRVTVADPHFDVQLVPVTILWGREPGKQDSVIRALLAESWQQVSTLRHLLAMLIHGRHTVVRFNAPLSLRAFLAGGDASRLLVVVGLGKSGDFGGVDLHGSVLPGSGSWPGGWHGRRCTLQGGPWEEV